MNLSLYTDGTLTDEEINKINKIDDIFCDEPTDGGQFYSCEYWTYSQDSKWTDHDWEAENDELEKRLRNFAVKIAELKIAKIKVIKLEDGSQFGKTLFDFN